MCTIFLVHVDALAPGWNHTRVLKEMKTHLRLEQSTALPNIDFLGNGDHVYEVDSQVPVAHGRSETIYNICLQSTVDNLMSLDA